MQVIGAFVVLIAVLNSSLISVDATKSFKRVCYVAFWDENFTPSSINASLCSHIIYAFAFIDSNNNLTGCSGDDTCQQTLNLRKDHPNLKVLLSVPGGSAGMQQASPMLQTSTTRSYFIKSCISFLRSYRFDGIDIDFEFPGEISTGSQPGDKQLFSTFLQEFRAAIKVESKSSGKPALLLTAAVSSLLYDIEQAYEIPNITQSVDWLNVMNYEYHGSWYTFTGLNTPLYARTGDDDMTLNINWTSHYYRSWGVPKEKLVIGLAFYGNCFLLTDPSQTGVGAPNSGVCNDQNYYQICGLLNNGATRVYSKQQQAPYLYINNQWMGYDDTESLKAKVKYITSHNFGGWMVWMIALDDYTGQMGCNKGPYPLLNAINKDL